MPRRKKLLDSIEYVLVRVIAEGGMGYVYEGLQKGSDAFEKTVAIKLIREEYSEIAEFRKNFIGEAKLVADLIHTNIVQTYHLGKVNEQYYMVMEYVSGINLEDFMLRHLEIQQAVPIELAVFLISRVCRGLAYAHEKKDKKGNDLGIVHRDVNPRNILLAFEGDVKLTDFGIAKAKDLMYNEEGLVIAGKDEYLSPEQARKEVTDPRADLFSCGVILSELLLGYNIFEGDTPEETHANILQGVLPNFSKIDKRVDKKLNDILHKSLCKKREDRYQSASEMLTELEVYLYSDGYGPTNEKLATYIHDLFDAGDATAVSKWKKAMKKKLSHPTYFL